MAAHDEPPTTAARAPRPRPEPGTLVVLIDGPVARTDLPGLCDRIRALLGRGDAGLVVCDVGALVDADAGVDSVAPIYRRDNGRLVLR